MDARWHPGNYFFLLVRFYGRRKLRQMLLPPLPSPGYAPIGWAKPHASQQEDLWTGKAGTKKVTGYGATIILGERFPHL